MNNRKKALLISFVLLILSIAISAVLYFVFHLVFIFLIFIPPVIYHYLSRRDEHGDTTV